MDQGGKDPEQELAAVVGRAANAKPRGEQGTYGHLVGGTDHRGWDQ